MTTPTSPDAGTTPQAPAAAAGPNLVHKLLVGLLAVAFVVVPVLFRTGTRAESDARGNALTGDGRLLVTQHEVLRECADGLGGLAGTFTTTWWGSIHPEKTLYRPLATFGLGVASYFAGPYNELRPGSSATPYYLFSLSLLAICALLVMELGWLLFRNVNMAFIGGALFATLPVHGEVLFDVAGMAELLCAVFSLAAWCAWVRSGRDGERSMKELGLVALFTFLASLSKESAFALPLVFFLTDIGLAREGGFGAGLAGALKRLPALMLPIGALGLSIGLRMSVAGGLVSEWHAGNTLDNALLDVGALERVMNALRLMGAGMLSMLGINTLSSNWNYSPDYSLNQVQVLGSFSLWNLVGLVGVVGSIVAAVALYTRCRMRAALFLCVPAAMLITSNLLFPIGTIYADRLLFFPSVAMVLFLAPFLGRMRMAGVLAALLLAAGGGFWTHTYAQNWESQDELWKYAANQSATESARAHHGRGIGLAREGMFFAAATSFASAIGKYDGMVEAYAHKALALFDDAGGERVEEGVDDMTTALERHFAGVGFSTEDAPGHRPQEVSYFLSRLTPSVIDLALTQGSPQPLEEHLNWLDSVVERGYDSEQIHLRRADVLRRLDRFEEARAAYERSWSIRPTAVCALSLGDFLERRELDQDALQVYVDATALPNLDPAARIDLALARANIESVTSPAQALATVTSIRQDSALTPYFDPSFGAAQSKRFYRMAAMEAIAQLQEAMDSGQDGPEHLEGVRNKLQLAMRAYQQIDSDTYFTLYALAHAHFHLGEYDDAKDLFERMLGVSEAPTQRIFLGRVLIEQDDPEAALEQFQIGAGTLAGMSTPEGDYRYEQDLLEVRLALVFLTEQVQGAEAVEALFAEWDTLASEEHDYVGVYLRSWWSARQGRPEEAVQWAERFAQLRPAHPGAQQLVAQASQLLAGEQAYASGQLDWSGMVQLAFQRYSMTGYSSAVELAAEALELAREAGVEEPALAQLRLLQVLAQRELRDYEAALTAARTALDAGDAMDPGLRASFEELAREMEGKLDNA